MKTFFKSISGTYYYGEFPVRFPVGYEVVSKEEYNAYYKAMGMPDMMVP